jgi:DNA-binding transcriptional LysR family regulator
MNITFRQLRLFLALADSGSVSAAARRMHVTQPTASMQLKEITQQVGIPLYEVVGRKLSLTEVGKRLAETARVITHCWESFEQEIDAFQGLTRGKIRVAVVSTAKYFMPRLVGSFCKLHPSIDVALEILNRDSVVERLRDNRDDFYIMSMPPGDIELTDESFMQNPIVVIASIGDPLSKAKSLGLNDLAKHRFILREKGSGTRMAADQHFRAMRFRPDIRLELGSNEAIKESVAGGLGLGVLSRHALHGHDGEHGVRILHVKGFPLASAWHIVHPSAKRLSPLAQAFKQHILTEVAKS